MKTKFVEVTNGFNWGKFMLQQFEATDWRYTSKIDPGRSLIAGRGFNAHDFWLCDLQTGEGACFTPTGYAGAAAIDLNKHRIWVCPLYEPFLAWLYTRCKGAFTFDDLPDVVELPDAPGEFRGHRRPGPAT